MNERETQRQREIEGERERKTERKIERVREKERLHAFTHRLFVPFIFFSNHFTFFLFNMLSIYLISFYSHV